MNIDIEVAHFKLDGKTVAAARITGTSLEISHIASVMKLGEGLRLALKVTVVNSFLVTINGELRAVKRAVALVLNSLYPEGET